MQQVSNGWDEPFYFRVTRGMSEHHRVVTRQGYNPNLTGTEGVWPYGGSYAFPPAASIMTISSTSVNDTSIGTGARLVLVGGLDAQYNEVQEIVQLNGQTPVSTIFEYLRCHTIIVLTAGALGQNDGGIFMGTGTVTAGVPANRYEYAAPGDNISQSLHYTVPAGWTATAVDVAGSSSQSSTNQHTVFYTKSRVEGGLFIRGGSVVCSGVAFSIPTTLSRELPPKTDTLVIAETSDTNVHIAGLVRFILTKEGYTIV